MWPRSNRTARSGQPSRTGVVAPGRSSIAALLVVVLAFTVACVASVPIAALNPQVAHAATPGGLATLTYKGDNLRSGHNLNESILNTSNVNSSTFGKRVSYPVDGQVYAQPLFMSGVSINGALHNVVFVATQHDSVYAFDADQTSAVAPLWHASFIDPSRGITTISSSDVRCNDIAPEYGITGTPVIDGNTGSLYVVANTKENGKNIYRLHVLDITTGLDKTGSPVTISGTVRGTGAGSSRGNIRFDPVHQLQRGALLLLNGVVYIPWGSHCDNNPYHGWITGYNTTTLNRVVLYNDTPNGTQGGIWESGQGLAADSNGYIYFMTGNGTFDINTRGVDAGDTIVKIDTRHNFARVDYFTPFNQSCLAAADADLGSGGTLLLPNRFELIGIGKEGRIYVVNRNKMGGYNTIKNACRNQGRTNVDKILQEFPRGTVAGGVWNTPAYWNGPSGEFVYTVGTADHVKAWRLTNGLLSRTPVSQSPERFTYPGGNVVISSNGTTAGTGVLWTLDPAGALRAYDATNLGHELYSGTLPSYVKFSVPTVVNGQVFVGTRNSLEIYGLLN